MLGGMGGIDLYISVSGRESFQVRDAWLIKRFGREAKSMAPADRRMRRKACVAPFQA